MEKTEYLHYKIPTLPYFYSPVMQASRCTWKDNHIIGEWFIRCNFSGDADIVVRSDQFSSYGDRFLALLLNNDEDFTEYLFGLGKRIISTANFLAALHYETQKFNKKVTLEDFYGKYERDFSEAIGFGYSLDYSLDQYVKRENISINQRGIHPSFIKREQLELSKIAYIDENAKQNALHEHLLRYSWLLNNYTGEHPTTAAYFERRLNDPAPLLDSVDIEIQKPKNLLDWIKFLTFLRDERKRMNLIAIGLMEWSIPTISADLSMDRERIVMHTVEEITEKQHKDIRTERYIRIMHSGIADETQDTWNKEFEKIKITDSPTEVRGIVANKGNIVGVAKIVIHREDFAKVQRGDVIVSSMTRPEFALILPICGAIVTNEGGVTCHAAIISRELHKPCVIGTKISTQVFHDGDIVEVDANTGVVRLLTPVQK